jgi:hypothetical protein
MSNVQCAHVRTALFFGGICVMAHNPQLAATQCSASAMRNAHLRAHFPK